MQSRAGKAWSPVTPFALPRVSVLLTAQKEPLYGAHLVLAYFAKLHSHHLSSCISVVSSLFLYTRRFVFQGERTYVDISYNSPPPPPPRPDPSCDYTVSSYSSSPTPSHLSLTPSLSTHTHALVLFQKVFMSIKPTASICTEVNTGDQEYIFQPLSLSLPPPFSLHLVLSS